MHVVRYIHQNPQRHRLVADYREWPFSSYSIFTSEKKTRLMREAALTWFDNIDGFHRVHTHDGSRAGIEHHFVIEFD
jgi:hypothetical protein